MAGSVNKVIIVGNLGRDPELRRTPGGAPVTDFSVATTERFSDKSGQRQEQTEWHNIVVWNRLAENAAQYLKKGSSVYIEGKLRTRSWEDNGQKRYRTEIIASAMQFLDSRPAGGGQGGFGGGNNQSFGEPPMDQGFGGGDQSFGGGFGGGDQGGFGGGNQGGGFGGGSAPMPNTSAPQQGFGGQSGSAPAAPSAPAGLPVEDELPF